MFLFVSEILSTVTFCEIVEVLLSCEINLTGRTLMVELVDFNCGVGGVVVGKVMGFFGVT